MGPGRPRTFESAEVLEAAMELFWTHGYERTSKRDLMEATGLASQSLYNAFGDKRTLFLEAIRHYSDARTAEHERRRRGLPRVRVLLAAVRRGTTGIGHRQLHLNGQRNP